MFHNSYVAIRCSASAGAAPAVSTQTGPEAEGAVPEHTGPRGGGPAAAAVS